MLFFNGLFLPAIAILTEKATGTLPDISCGGFVLGVVSGWLPALLLASMGRIAHNLFFRNNRKSPNN